MLKIEPDGLIRDENGQFTSEFVDSFIVGEGMAKNASAVIFRLYERSSFAYGAIGSRTDKVSREDCHQFRMSPKRARALGKALMALADEVDGIGAPRQ